LSPNTVQWRSFGTGSVLNLMSHEGVTGVLKVLLQLLAQKEWEARHGGLLGLKYLLAVREVTCDVKFDFQTLVLLEIHAFWGVTPCYWASKGKVFLLQAQLWSIGWVEVYLYPFLTTALEGGVFSSTPRPNFTHLWCFRM